jgi:hypothetical protein
LLNFDIGAWLRDPVLISIVTISVALFLVFTVVWGILLREKTGKQFRI